MTTTNPDRVDLSARLAAIRPARPARVVVAPPAKFPRSTRDLNVDQIPAFGGSEVR